MPKKIHQLSALKTLNFNCQKREMGRAEFLRIQGQSSKSNLGNPVARVQPCRIN
ncbi:hypothetical protein M595_3815 [Lyngbya aestuarii BL J]|uniref:Uncharacterized protein n=1 Tax=Lyngbya aestuarii BL J TaxID=1348334 RepID=U7QG16_9CYAN|nr:hypothetical protein M595_3815 [Lyngbya aestuarii BL J]